jgi:hypothetical protein
MKKYFVCILAVFGCLLSHESLMQGSDNDRLPVWCLRFESGNMSKEELAEYAKYRAQQILIAAGQQKTPSLQSFEQEKESLPNDQIGQRAFFPVVAVEKSWSSNVLSWVMGRWRK